jgi:hypothetical protein
VHNVKVRQKLSTIAPLPTRRQKAPALRKQDWSISTRRKHSPSRETARPCTYIVVQQEGVGPGAAIEQSKQDHLSDPFVSEISSCFLRRDESRTSGPQLNSHLEARKRGGTPEDPALRSQLCPSAGLASIATGPSRTWNKSQLRIRGILRLRLVL